MAAARPRRRDVLVEEGDIGDLLDVQDSGEDFSDEGEVSDYEDELLGQNRSSTSDEDNDEGRNDLGLLNNDDEWETYTSDQGDFDRLLFTVTNPGFRVPINNRPKTVLGYFQLFFTDTLLEEIVTETNRYAKEKIMITTPLAKQSIWNSWVDVSLKEFKAFLGVLLNMGLNEKTDIKEYFSNEWIDTMPFFRDIFTRTRFLQIFWCLHLCPPTATNGVASRNRKIKNIADYIDSKCRELYIPQQDIAVDESTVGFKGRVVFLCYNPKKPVKWGLRIYVLGDSNNGYISAFVPYYGSTTTAALCHPEKPFTTRIVLQLCQMLLSESNGSGFHLYTDRFYTGVDLSLELLKLKIHTTGTVQTNRKGLPNVVRKKKLKVKKFEQKAFHSNKKLMFLGWKDKRLVSMLSTFHNTTSIEIQRHAKRGEIETIQKPVVIHDYTQKMGAVDRADHFCSSYAFTRKSLKWWRKLFFWIIEVAIVNSFILFNINRIEKGEKSLKHKAYRKQLILELVGDQRVDRRRKRGRPSTLDTEERLNGLPHFIYKNDNRNSKDCAVCSNRNAPGGRKETVFYCDTCTRKPGLHPGDCFKMYHTMKKYK